MKKITIEQEEIQLLNKAAKGITILQQLPDYGHNFPSFGDMEIIYDTSMECSVQNDGKDIQLSLFFIDEEDDDYAPYKIEPDEYGDFKDSIESKLILHNNIFYKGK